MSTRVSETAEDLRLCVPLDLHFHRSSAVDRAADDVAAVTQQQQPAAAATPRLTVWNAEDCQRHAGGSPHSGVPSVDESSSSSEYDRDQVDLRVGADYLAPPATDSSPLVDGRYRRRRSVRSSSTSSASSSSISPPPATAAAAASGTTSRAKYACDECDRRYATSSNLSRHKQTHRSVDGEHARPCPHCRKVYVSMPALSMHLLTHDLKYRCSACDKAFSRPWLLRGHERSHTGEKPFACAMCGKAFADRSNLRAHVQTHSGAKRFRCSRCLKTFALKSYLTTGTPALAPLTSFSWSSGARTLKSYLTTGAPVRAPLTSVAWGSGAGKHSSPT